MAIPQLISTPAEVKTLRYIHMVQGVLFFATFIVGIAKAASVTGRRRSRSDSWIIAVSVKSMVFLAYIVLSERLPKLRRFASLKAFSILAWVETVFWFVAMGITGVSIGPSTGTTKTLGGVCVALAVVLALLSLPVTYISTRFFFYRRTHGVHPDENHYSRETTSMTQARTTSTQSSTSKA